MKRIKYITFSSSLSLEEDELDELEELDELDEEEWWPNSSNAFFFFLSFFVFMPSLLTPADTEPPIPPDNSMLASTKNQPKIHD